MNTKGFTLIEAMVAVTIITLAIVGPMYAADRATVAAEIAQEQLTASSLAQEGIEYVRLMRDDAFLSENENPNNPANASTNGWQDFSSAGSGSSNFSIKPCDSNSANKACTLDPSLQMGTQNGDSLNSCNIGANKCPYLYLNPTTGIYTQQSSGNKQTIFIRTIQAMCIPSSANCSNSTEEKIISTVTWTFHGSTYSEVATDHLTPWQ